MHTRCFGWLVAGLCLASASSLATAQDKSAAAISKYVNEYWKAANGAEVNQEVDGQFEQLTEKFSGDSRAYYAHALVCMRQRRFEQANHTVAKLLGFEANHLGAHRLTIWLALLNKQYGEAIAAADAATEIVVKAAADPLQKEEAEDVIRFLGVVFGFLEGPIGETPSSAARATVEKKLVAMLSPEQALFYKDARQSVLEKHAGLLNAKEDKKEKGAADDDAEKERKLAEIEARRKGMETDKETLKERRKELEGRLREEQAAFNKADAPLADQQNRLESQGLSIQRSLGNMQADMASLEATMAAEKDRTRLALLQIELGRITRIYRNLDADLFAIRRTDQGIISKRQSLAAQAARSQQDLGGQLAGIDKQTLGLNGEAKRLENTERQTLKGGPGVKTHAMSLTASALNTYEPFPLDQEKLRLLALLK